MGYHDKTSIKFRTLFLLSWPQNLVLTHWNGTGQDRIYFLKGRINTVASPAWLKLLIWNSILQNWREGGGGCFLDYRAHKNSELNAASQFNTSMIKQYTRCKVPTFITRNFGRILSRNTQEWHVENYYKYIVTKYARNLQTCHHVVSSHHKIHAEDPETYYSHSQGARHL